MDTWKGMCKVLEAGSCCKTKCQGRRVHVLLPEFIRPGTVVLSWGKVGPPPPPCPPLAMDINLNIALYQTDSSGGSRVMSPTIDAKPEDIAKIIPSASLLP